MKKVIKVKKMLQAMPELVNDDLSFQLYVFGRFLEKYHAPPLTKEQILAYKDMGNPDNWSRERRTLREKDPDIKKLISRESAKSSIEKERAYREKYRPVKTHWSTIFNN